MSNNLNKIIRIFLPLLYLFVLAKVNATTLQDGTKELGGSTSGFVQNHYNFTSFGSNISPTFNYYFSNHWFVGTGISLGYIYEKTRHLSANYTSSYAQVSPRLGIGYYAVLTDNLAFALPIFVEHEFNFGFVGYLSDRDASSLNMGAYSIEPTLKIRVGENVLISPFVSIRNFYFSQLAQEMVFRIFYGIAWTYIW